LAALLLVARALVSRECPKYEFRLLRCCLDASYLEEWVRSRVLQPISKEREIGKARYRIPRRVRSAALSHLRARIRRHATKRGLPVLVQKCRIRSPRQLSGFFSRHRLLPAERTAGTAPKIRAASAAEGLFRIPRDFKRNCDATSNSCHCRSHGFAR
jgi:hypothetical protein